MSLRAYLLFTAPGGYLSFSPLHCDCHGDTQIPRSAGLDPHPLLHKAVTPHLHTWGCRPQNLLLAITEWKRCRREKTKEIYQSIYLSICLSCWTIPLSMKTFLFQSKNVRSLRRKDDTFFSTMLRVSSYLFDPCFFLPLCFWLEVHHIAPAS